MKRQRLENRFEYEEKKGITFHKDTDRGRSRTAKSFAKEANINTIIERYNKTGLLTDPLKQNARLPNFGDFTNSTDFFDLNTKVLKMKEEFAKIPGKVRAKFNNNIGQMLDFVANPDNLKEAVELGLLSPELLPPAHRGTETPPGNAPVNPPGA